MKKLISLFLLLACLFTTFDLWARAGGAGGGGSHSSGGSSHSSGGYSSGHSSSNYYSGYSSYDSGSSSSSSETLLIIVIFIIALIIFFNKNKNQNSSQVDSTPNLYPPVGLSLLNPQETQILIQKVGTAFLSIQKAWSEKNISIMRRFISDGVYQRFNAQFIMMNALAQTDEISQVRIQNIHIMNSRHEGIFDIVDVQIAATTVDQFVSHKYPNLNSEGGEESFIEYWSFIRRTDYKKSSDLFHSENCPNCAAPLKAQLIETARCQYCGTYLNNGQYDWVLAEITQEADYLPTNQMAEELQKQKRLQLEKAIPDFSKQLIEDFASNAFMQIVIAQVTKNPAPLIRFSDPLIVQKLKHLMASTNFLFDRLFLNACDIYEMNIVNQVCEIKLNIKYSYRRVQLANNQAYLLEEDLQTENKQITLYRELSGHVSKGSIYANSCSNCGAPQKDSLSSVCAFCNTPLNNSKNDWIVLDLV